MRIIPATKEMIAKHCKGGVSCFALAVVEDEKLLGIGGIYLQSDCQVMFSWISEELKARPKAIIKVWKALLEKRLQMPLVAQCDLGIAKSELMLLHLGFLPHSGNIWIYRGR